MKMAAFGIVYRASLSDLNYGLERIHPEKFEYRRWSTSVFLTYKK